MALLEFKTYYRQLGMRRVQTLASPVLTALHELPRNALLHFLSHDPEIMHIDPTLPYLGTYLRKKIITHFVSQPTRDVGIAGHRTVNLRAETQEWFRANRKFVLSTLFPKDLRDETQLGVVNYNYVNGLSRYVENLDRARNEYLNVTHTLMSTISDLMSTTDRTHVLNWELPAEIVKLAILEQLVATPWTARHRTTLATPAMMNLYELWMWLTPARRADSVFSRIRPEDYGRVQLLLPAQDGRHVVMSLAYLNSWIRGEPNQTEFRTVQTLEPPMLRKFAYNLYVTLAQSATAVAETADAVKELVDTEDSESEEDTAVGLAAAVPETTDDPATRQALVQLNAAEDLDALAAEIEDNISAIDTIDASKPMIDDAEEVDNYDEVLAEILKPVPTETLLARKLEEYAVTGRVTAAQYRQIEKEIRESALKPEPYGSGKTRLEFGDVKPEDLQIKPEEIDLAVNTTRVPDKSMHATALRVLDRKYIEQVLPRDVVRMVSALQRGGVIVRDHSVESVVDIQGEAEIHTLDIKPIDGKPSRLRFKIPKLREDGTYVAGGNRYVMRRQRFDVPIRKIGPDTVQLASYYGKTQISLSDKAVDSSSRWVLSKLQAYALGEPGLVTGIVPGEAYDPEFEAPAMYSTISEAFLSFKVQRNTYVFDHRRRAEMAAQLGIDLKKIETKGRVLCGYTPKSEPIVITSKNNFKVLRQDAEETIGDVYTLLQLDAQKAPLDLAQIRIGRHQVPVGLMLGYYIGLPNLLKLIKAKYRVAPSGKRVELEQHEYRLRFADQTYIFDRREPLTTMLMAGYLKYERSIRNYGVKDFRNPGTFISILQSAGGMSATVIRDMDMMRDMFIDPITLTVLQERKEPETFQGLTLLGCQMLINRHHPVSQDAQQQRLRGSERIAGAVYSEMVRQLKAYRTNRSGRVEMSPWAVWARINGDQSGKITEDINPIQHLKEQESVTYVGEGGRDKSSINKKSRAFHRSDIGLMSEAGVDSGDVGVNTFLAANPKINSLYGTVDAELKTEPANILSTSGLLAPFGDKDDMLIMSTYRVTGNVNFL